LLQQEAMEVTVVTSGTLRTCEAPVKLQPAPILSFTGRMPFLSPNRLCQNTGGIEICDTMEGGQFCMEMETERMEMGWGWGGKEPGRDGDRLKILSVCSIDEAVA